MSLSKIQSRLVAPKDKDNEFGKYKYRSLERILEAVKPLLLEFNYTILFSDEIIERAGRVYVESTAILFDEKMAEVASCKASAREAQSKKGMDDAQVTGSTSSYARKYAANGLFAIDDNKDPDSNERAVEERKAREKAEQEEEKRAAKAEMDKTAKKAAKKAVTDLVNKNEIPVEIVKATIEKTGKEKLAQLDTGELKEVFRILEAGSKMGGKK